ncbi:2-oxoacid:ferredoxin oxidoreductase subunit beta, partial [Candidatus Bathyarchaeota archaeon]|nr:2-oxoacid:ferredoxin oxidoreductase subunit beta [Candidatus Bathyarchaeota archaeon]
FGRRAGFKDAGEMLRWFKEKSIQIEQAEKIGENELAERIVIGEFVQRRRPTLVEAVSKIVREAQNEIEKN